MFAGHIAHIHRQPAGQAQAGQGRSKEHLGQVGRILQREQRHRIEAVEDAPAGVIEGANSLGFVGEKGAQPGHKTVVIPIDGQMQTSGQVILQLGRIGDRFTGLAHIGQGPGEQVGVTLLAEAKDHRGAHIKGVALAPEAAARAAGNQVALQHQHLRPLGGQLAGGHQAADAGSDHHHVPRALA